MIWKRGGLVAEVRTASEGRVALLHLDSSQPVVLEGTAAAIWELVDGRRNQAELVAELEAAFEDAAGTLAQQVQAFLASLEARRLIEAAGAATK